MKKVQRGYNHFVLFLLLQVTGCVLIGIGVCVFISSEKAHLFRVVTAVYEYNASEPFYIARDGLSNISYALVIIGIFIILSGLLGCYGLLQDRKCMMATHFSFLFVLVCAELSLVVVTMTYREHILSGMPDRITSTIQHLYAKDTALTNSVDYTQYMQSKVSNQCDPAGVHAHFMKGNHLTPYLYAFYYREANYPLGFQFNCCGSLSDKDYMNSNWRNTTSPAKNVPLTCCPLLNKLDVGAYMNPDPVDEKLCQEGNIDDKLSMKEVRYNLGCLSSLEAWFQEDSSIIIAIGVSMASLHVIAMVLSVCLCRSTEDLI
ncbi:hypothetical protein J437_LFUL001991 [Ladona fulva]|uniref:Tetraspanin n=1 Tax=Ladona fulva TaxID=123851 RepID=A0A8K0NVX2_LADFU|nr:hypothetical protein J437_LFUL001991 [Ladona fulva]